MQIITSKQNKHLTELRSNKPAWIAIGGLILFTFLGILLGAGSIIRLFFPIASLATGLYLYSNFPILYIGFTWWLWFLTPFVSRLIDYRSGWDPSRLVLVTPFIVTIITTITVVKHLLKTYKYGGLPFFMVFVAISYATLIGLVNNQLFAVARSFLDWFAPVAFAFHIWVNWREYPRYRQVIQSTFLWGLLIMGVYGIFQYLVAPEWDGFWLVESGMTSSSGSPEPLGMRVWSTMHSRGPFASTMQAGLLLVFTHKSIWRFPAAIAGTISLLLSTVRSAWGGWILSLLLFIPSLKSRLQLKIITTLLIFIIIIVPLTRVEPFKSQIQSRLQTLTNIEKDSSFQARQDIYSESFKIALSTFQGRGLGYTWSFEEQKFGSLVIDSGILDTFFTLGWIGAIPYLGGLLLIVINIIKNDLFSHDSFLNTTRALGISYCATLIIGSIMLSVGGMLLWGFLSITLAGKKYYFKNKGLKDI